MVMAVTSPRPWSFDNARMLRDEVMDAAQTPSRGCSPGPAPRPRRLRRAWWSSSPVKTGRAATPVELVSEPELTEQVLQRLREAGL
jgi:hypothetical protein